MLKIAVCVDNEEVMKCIEAELKNILEKNSIIGSVIFCCTNPTVLEKMLITPGPDLYIFGNFCNSLSKILPLAAQIRATSSDAFMVYTAPKLEIPIDLQNLNIFSFLQFPVPTEKFEDLLLKINDFHLKKNNSTLHTDEALVISFNDEIRRICLNSILFIETFPRLRRCMINTRSRVFYTCETLKNVFSRLPSNGKFVQCHRSYIVNIDKIRKIDRKQRIITLQNGYRCPIGGTYMDNLVNCIIIDS